MRQSRKTSLAYRKELCLCNEDCWIVQDVFQVPPLQGLMFLIVQLRSHNMNFGILQECSVLEHCLWKSTDSFINFYLLLIAPLTHCPLPQAPTAYKTLSWVQRKSLKSLRPMEIRGFLKNVCSNILQRVRARGPGPAERLHCLDITTQLEL